MSLKDKAVQVWGGEQDIAPVDGDGGALGEPAPEGQGTPPRGGRAKIPNSRGQGVPVPINRIAPDIRQPRRTMPQALRYTMTSAEPDDMAALFDTWATAAGQEYGTGPLDLKLYLDHATPLPDADTAYAGSLIRLLDLALDIRARGLTYPITAVRLVGTDWHMIETGERRWLAFQLLFWLTGDEQWAKIPVRPYEEFNAYRQASENAHRQDLNLVARSRQFALLLMAANPESVLIEYGDCLNDQAYYAQALELEIPYGKGKELLGAMGINSRSQFTTYRKVLAIPPELWTRADDENWSEQRLFDALNSLKNPPAQPEPEPTPDHPLADPAVKKAFTRLFNGAKSGAFGQYEDRDTVREWLNLLDKRQRDFAPPAQDDADHLIDEE